MYSSCTCIIFTYFATTLTYMIWDSGLHFISCSWKWFLHASSFAVHIHTGGIYSIHWFGLIGRIGTLSNYGQFDKLEFSECKSVALLENLKQRSRDFSNNAPGLCSETVVYAFVGACSRFRWRDGWTRRRPSVRHIRGRHRHGYGLGYKRPCVQRATDVRQTEDIHDLSDLLSPIHRCCTVLYDRLILSTNGKC